MNVLIFSSLNFEFNSKIVGRFILKQFKVNANDAFVISLELINEILK